jgi:hypothetical protein
MLLGGHSNSAWYSWNISTWNFVTRLTNKEHICVWQILITLTKSQMKLSFPWENLSKLWIVFKRKNIQAKDNNTSKSTKWPKLVVIWKWVFMSMSIFIKKNWYLVITFLEGFNIEIHFIFTIFNILSILDSIMLANFVSFKWCLGLFQKHWCKT